jgi:2-polyprenyl-3-methyl-5-hydroxy-6-metoxy-1,4-benzoquinol methylase
MWDERYNTPEYVFGEQPCQWLVMNAHRIPTAGRALALGDGEGRNGVYLASLGLSVTSVDLSAVGLTKAQALATRRGLSLETVQADLADYVPESNAFTLACSIYTHLPSPARETIHRRVEAAMQPGGLFIMEAFHHMQLKNESASGGPKTIDLLYRLEELLSDFSAMRILDAFEGQTLLDEGPRHQGLGQVVRLVLEKQ